jgi:TatD DNase family protein
LLEIKKQLKPKQLWIVHGFRGKPELARQLLKSDCAISYGEHFNVESVRNTPLDKLFIETDESLQNIETIYNSVALAKGCDSGKLTAVIFFYNRQSVFHKTIKFVSISF